MPSNQTANYQLSQWAKSDQVRMEDFNADNAKIDAAIKAVQQKADSLATSKADASVVAALSQTSASHTASIAKLGNCAVYHTSYTGSGGQRRSMTFPHSPSFIFVANRNDGTAFAAPWGTNPAVAWLQGGNNVVGLTWNGNSVTWSNWQQGSTFLFDQTGATYFVVALLDASA